jgi:hypothetical protein
MNGKMEAARQIYEHVRDNTALTPDECTFAALVQGYSAMDDKESCLQVSICHCRRIYVDDCRTLFGLAIV